jgi:hypothetical protein
VGLGRSTASACEALDRGDQLLSLVAARRHVLAGSAAHGLEDQLAVVRTVEEEKRPGSWKFLERGERHPRVSLERDEDRVGPLPVDRFLEIRDPLEASSKLDVRARFEGQAEVLPLGQDEERETGEHPFSSSVLQ